LVSFWIAHRSAARLAVDRSLKLGGAMLEDQGVREP